MSNIMDNIKFTYTKAQSQSNLFSPEHTKFQCTITYRGVRFNSMYQCNIAYIQPNKEDFLFSCIKDAMWYDQSRDFSDFCACLGYDEYDPNAKRIYKACGDCKERLEKVFSSDELEELRELANEW